MVHSTLERPWRSKGVRTDKDSLQTSKMRPTTFIESLDLHTLITVTPVNTTRKYDVTLTHRRSTFLEVAFGR